MKKRIKFLSLILAAIALLSMFTAAGCSNSDEYPVTVASYTFTEQPNSVICLNDSVADILIACGYSDIITARSDECTQSELSDIHSVGSASNPDVTEIKSFNPDVVFADKTLSEDIRTQLKNANIDVLTIVSATTTEELVTLYGNICAILDGDQTGRENGESKAESLAMTLTDLQRLVPDSDVVQTACYLYDTDGTVETSDSLGGKLFDYANIVNVCSSSTSDDDMLESIKLSNPLYIFCDTGVKEQIENSEYFQDFTAVKNGNVYELPAEYLSRQGNSLAEALSYIIETVYPEVRESSDASDSSEDSESSESSETSEASEASENSETSEEESSSTGVEEDTSLEITDSTVISLYETSDNVSALQTRLKYLGYFDEDITGYYGSMTASAVYAFKSNNDIDTDSTSVSADELRLMFSSEAVPADSFES